MDICRSVFGPLHEASEERFLVEFLDKDGRCRNYGPDSAAGIIAYLLPADTVVSVVKV